MGMVKNNDVETSSVFSVEDDSHMTSVSYTPRHGELEINDNFIVLEEEDVYNTSKYNSYNITRDLFSRCLALIYFFSFLVDFNQITGMVGSDGIWPALGHTSSLVSNGENNVWDSVKKFPSLFMLLRISNFTLNSVAFIGMLVSVLVALTGFCGCYTFCVLWIFKLSLHTVMTTLPDNACDLILLECGFLAIFIYSPFKVFDHHTEKWTVPLMCRWCFRWLAYRVIFSAGISKLNGFNGWLDLSAFKYLMQSIALPTPFTYYFYKFADVHPVLNSTLTGVLLFFECVLSIFIMTPIRYCRLLGGALTMFYALFFTIVGNFGTFYLTLAVAALFCFDDAILEDVINYKYNIFTKASVLARRVSVDVIESALDDYEEVETKTDIADDSFYDNGLEVDEHTFSSNLIKTITYKGHKEYIKELLFSDGSLNNVPVRYHSYVQLCIQMFLLLMIVLLSVLCMTTKSYRYLKATFIFIFALLLQAHCEVTGTTLGYLVDEYTLFALQAWLMMEMLINGPEPWSFVLWVSILELQLGLALSMNNLQVIFRALIQVFVVQYVLFYSTPLVLKSLNKRIVTTAPFGIINYYGGVTTVTPTRYELVIQGTLDNVIKSDTSWKEYTFKCKPSDPHTRPCFLPFYNYELDAILNHVSHLDLNVSSNKTPIYLIELVKKLLDNSSDTLGLFQSNPFEKQPPKYVRILNYQYTFNDGVGEQGSWYNRELKGVIVPPLYLNDHYNHHNTSGNKSNFKVTHIVRNDNHNEDSRNVRGMPLEMADGFNHVIPNVDGLILTKN